MKKCELLVFILIAVSLFCSCTSTTGQRFNFDTRSRIDPRGAQSLAKQEIDRRELPLPGNWKAQVRDSFVDYEFQPARAIFAVTFYAVINGKRKDLYEVNIDKQSGKVEDFLDVRRAVRIQDH